MATKVTNEKGFLVISMTPLEATSICGFGVFDRKTKTPIVIDDNTNEIINDEVYYVAVLNRAFSKNTYEKWYANAIRYKEDIPYEKRYFNYYSNLLNL